MSVKTDATARWERYTFPPIAKCAMDGAPEDRWPVRENDWTTEDGGRGSRTSGDVVVLMG
ncbi:hypothetical protein [Granulicella sp. L60]|uniref:hypothetical protein n=1 Tax=Granulicella sp. L60 TaxID=1641866 RepID=UPI00131E043E|nr:hypothetical protein [Granulicella sp. L60]